MYSINQKKLTYITLVLITLFGAIIRVIWLDRSPPSLNWDEVSHAYNAYSLLLTGKDQWGEAFPISNFRAYGDYPASLNIYLTASSIFIFGPSDLSVKIPHIIVGTMLIPLVFVLVTHLTKKSSIGLVSSLLVATEAWTLFPSRSIFQSNHSILFVTLFITLFLRKSYGFSMVSLVLAAYSYHNSRIFIPLILPILLFLYKKHRFAKKTFFLGLIALAPIFVSLISGTGTARNKWVGIIDQGAINFLEQVRNQSDLPQTAERLIYNRYTYFIYKFVENYLGYFTAEYLFIKGGTQYQYSVQGFGVVSPVLVIPLIIGVYIAYKKQKLMSFWLILSPIAAAATKDQFAVIRSNLMALPIYFFMAIGIYTIQKKLGRWSVIVLLPLFGAYISGSIGYWNNYTNIYPKIYSSSWQFGYKEAISKIKNDYDEVIFTKYYGEPHEFYWWYKKTNPREVQANKDWEYRDGWYWVNSYQNIRFVNDWEITSSTINSNKSTLVIASPNNIPNGGETINIINSLGGETLFVLKKY